ncbi:MAG: hypothetical protein ABIH18_07210 [Candidatus Omnitrophota bacterium]
MEKNKRRIKYLATSFQKKLLFLVFASAVIPAAITAVCMYYLIFNMIALQMFFPEIIARNLMPVLHRVNVILAIAMPVVFIVIWFVSLELSNRMAGPLYRIEKELDARLQGIKQGPIRLRKKDEFKTLAEKINSLICK